MASTPNSPPLLAAIRRAIADKYSLVIWFLAINVVAGSAGLWAPLIPAIRNGTEAVSSRMLELLQSGGAYTFLIAYLAATSGYVITEYVERSDQFFRGQKAALVALAFVIALISAFFTRDLFSASRPTSVD